MTSTTQFPPLAPELTFAAMLLAFLSIGITGLMKHAPMHVHISAEQSGLTARTRWGRRVYMTWHRVRMIELQRTPPVRDATTQNWVFRVQVEVRDDRHLIVWEVWSKEPPERLMRHAELIAALEHYSGRTSHAFDLEDPLRAVGMRLDLLAYRLRALVGIAVAGGVGAAFGLFDSNHAFWFILTGFFCAALYWSSLHNAGRKMRLARSGTSTPIAPTRPAKEHGPLSEYDPQALYEMTVGSYQLFRATRWLSVVFGICLIAAGGGMALVVLLSHQLGAWIGIITALVGIVITVVSLRARDTVVIAQHDGLRKRWMLRDTLIPWQDIASIRRRRTWFTVRTRSSWRRIAWPFVPFDNPQTPQVPGAILINPLQMASVVERRTGLAVQDARPV